MNAAQFVNQTSGDVEFYSPSDIVEAARRTMGAIDLDPASSEIANARVRAMVFFSEPAFEIVGEIGGLPIRRYADRGALDLEWFGRDWLNPPFLKPDRACEADCQQERCTKRGWHTAADIPGTGDWIAHLETQYKCANVEAACCITFAATSERWFRPLLRRPQCFPFGRTNYHLPDGTLKQGVTKGSVITYYGNDVASFAAEFRRIGVIKLPL